MPDDSLTQTEPTELSITPGPLVGPVLRRVVGMLAARADLPLDRLDDAVLVADVIAERAGAYAPDAIRIRFEVEPRQLRMRIGPLSAGGAQALLGENRDVGPIIVKLADEVRVEEAGDDEYLSVCLAFAG